MVIKKGKSILRAALDEELITEVKVAAARIGVNPNAIAEAALRMFLSDEQNIEKIKPNQKK